MTMMHGADADGLDRVAVQISTAAEELQTEMNALTANLRSIEWLGAIATSFTDDWMGTGLAQIRSTTGFLKAASTNLQQQATAQREASKGGGPHGGSIHATGTGSGSTPGAKIRERFDANRAALEEYLRALPPDSSLRKAIEKNLAAGAEVYYFDPDKGYIAWATPNLVNAENVVMTIPGTDNDLESVTNDFLGQAHGYQSLDNDVAVISTYTWRPPPSIPWNLAWEPIGGFDTLSDGPTPGILGDLFTDGKVVVPTAHSAGANAFEIMMAQHPGLAKQIRGVALLAPSELDVNLPGSMRGRPILVGLHVEDPMLAKLLTVNGDEVYRYILAPNARIKIKASGLDGPINLDAHGQNLYIKNFGQDVLDLFKDDPFPLPPGVDPTQPIS